MATLLRSDGTWKCLAYPSVGLVSAYSLKWVMNNTLLAPLVLNMTSNTTPSPYVASASSSYNSTYYPYKAFNGTNSSSSDCWISASGQTTGWLAIDLGSQKLLVQYAVTSRNEASTGPTAAPKDWTFEGSNDGTNWAILDTRTGQTGWAANETRVYTIAAPGYYRYYRLNISANNGYASYVAVGELTLYTGNLGLSSLNLSLGVFRLAQTPGSGQCVSTPLSLYGMKATGNPIVNWDGDEQGVTLELDVSLDGGTSWSGWQVVARGGALPGVDQTTNLDTVLFRYRLTLTSETDVSPVVSNIRLENVVGWDEVQYDDSSWAAVYDNGAYGISPWSSNVTGWPDSSARWIWSQASTSSVPAGDVYFRKTFTLEVAAWVAIGFACDDRAELYVDGQYLLGNSNYKAMSGNSIYLPAGNHVIAVKTTNSAAGTAGLLLTARDAFAGVTGYSPLGERIVPVFSGFRTDDLIFGQRQERSLTANVYIVDIFNTGPSTRKVGDYFLGVRSSMEQEVPTQPPSGGTAVQVRRFPFSWVPPLVARWRPRV